MQAKDEINQNLEPIDNLQVPDPYTKKDNSKKITKNDLDGAIRISEQKFKRQIRILEKSQTDLIVYFSMILVLISMVLGFVASLKIQVNVSGSEGIAKFILSLTPIWILLLTFCFGYYTFKLFYHKITKHTNYKQRKKRLLKKNKK